jgi:hypothetical protein
MIELWDGGEATPSSKLKAGEYNDNSNNPARIVKRLRRTFFQRRISATTDRSK